MSSIILYAGENCVGISTSYTRNQSSFPGDNSVKSIRVEGDKIWILYSEDKYKGDVAVFKQGEYKTLSSNVKGIKSIRILNGTLENHSITVYEEDHFQDQEHDITTEKNPRPPYPIKSHKVNGGVWLLYDKPEYRGNRIVIVAGDSVDDETIEGLGEIVRSLKAYVTYETPN